MKRWEYSEIHWTQDECSRTPLVDRLNAEGTEGWELVTMDDFGTWGVFKRLPPGFTKGWR